MQSYNFFGQSPGQMAPSQNPALLAQQMQLQEFNNPTSSQAQSIKGGGIDPQALARMMQSQQYAPGYTDNAGVSGQTLQSYGIAPGVGGNMFGLGNMSMFGGGGNPLQLSSGSQFSPQDMAALQGAFNG